VRKDATQDRPPILQIRAVASLLAETSQVPSGATTNARTGRVWPVEVWRVCPVPLAQGAAGGAGHPRAPAATCPVRLNSVGPDQNQAKLSTAIEGNTLMARLLTPVRATVP
jgi:hypothetical protein